jgi:hypothetical protein
MVGEPTMNKEIIFVHLCGPGVLGGKYSSEVFRQWVAG